MVASVREHYAELLSEVYSWMYGGFASGIEKGRLFYAEHRLRPLLTGLAIDLGAGCGFHSIPLAEAGFEVTAIEQDNLLLRELQNHAGSLPIRAIAGDLLDFKRFCPAPVELVTCMTDTVILLDSKAVVAGLFKEIYDALLPGGRFIVSFRDLSGELNDLDRFLPVRSDKDLILTCFLEYEPETVKVHDIVYKRKGNGWELIKGFYRKLRLSKDWAAGQLAIAGFTRVDVAADRGFMTFICLK